MLTTINSTVLLQGLGAQGNEEAWNQFYARYEPVLLGVALRAGLRHQDAHDVVHEAMLGFLEGYKAGHYDRQRGRLRAYLQGIMFNKIREFWARNKRREVQMVEPSDATGFFYALPDDAVLQDIFEEEWRRGIMQACLAELQRQLDPDKYQVFKRYALEDQPADRVAEELNVSRNDVYVIKSRALARLRRIQRKMSDIW